MRTLVAMMIPVVWHVSPSKLWPVIIHEDVGCNDPPPRFNWLDEFGGGVDWMTRNAYGKRQCIEGRSYWLVTPQDYGTKCSTGTGEVSCAAWDISPDFNLLERPNGAYGVTVRDFVEGSANTWKENDRRNGAPIPDLNTGFYDVINAQGLIAPGVFNIPVCGMEEARANWERTYNGATPWKNFPCNA